MYSIQGVIIALFDYRIKFDVWRLLNLMNKTDLVSKMSEKSGLSKKDCEVALGAFIDSITEALQAGDKVQMIGFGTFEVRERAARTGRSPQTGESIDIPASRLPVFKAGKSLKDCVNL